MTFQNFQTDNFCVGGRHRPSTKVFYVDITSKVSKVLIGYCSICHRKISMTVSDNIVQAEGLSSFFQKLEKDFC